MRYSLQHTVQRNCKKAGSKFAARFPASGSRPCFAWNNGLCAARAVFFVHSHLSSQFTNRQETKGWPRTFINPLHCNLHHNVPRNENVYNLRTHIPIPSAKAERAPQCARNALYIFPPVFFFMAKPFSTSSKINSPQIKIRREWQLIMVTFKAMISALQ